jgi:hypothetical protein
MNAERQYGGHGKRRALLFSGHMIDAPGRTDPRFPPAFEPAVARAIRAELYAVRAGSNDLAFASAACGGDILFDEAVLERGVPLTVYLPFDERTFLGESVTFANDRWPDRYRAVVDRSQHFIAPEVLGPLPAGADPYERTNQWMLDDATRLGGGAVVFICLWNGAGGDGPGGTKHMMDAVRSSGGEVHWIDIRTL